MIRIKRQSVIDAMQLVPVKEPRSHKALVDDILYGNGMVALSFLIKRRYLKFPNNILEKELDNMVERSLITIIQEENTKRIIYITDGNYRVTQFMKKQKRFVIIG